MIGRTDGVDAALAAGRAAWPDLAVDPDVLRAWFDQHGDVDDLADAYLACAVASGAGGAIAAFEAYCMPVITAAVARLGARDIADEVAQSVRVLVLVGSSGRPLIEAYAGRGSLRAWIRVIAVREAMRVLRGRDRHVPIGDELMFDAIAPTEHEDPELEFLKTHYREQFRRAFIAAIAKLDRRERIALRMNVIDGRSIDEIGAAFRSHRSSAHRWLANARRALLDHTRTALAAELAIDSAEVDSLIRLMRSSLSVDAADFASQES